MLSRIPITAKVGLLASALAVGLWAMEQLTGWLAFEFITIPFKVALLVAPLFFLSDLSGFLRGRPILALGLGVALVGVTLFTMLAYLPWRDTFAHHFNNSVYRWYTLDNNPRFAAEGDFVAWQEGWVRHIPRRIEALLVFAYYGLLITTSVAFRLRRITGAVVAVVGYALLVIVPFATELIVLDYDTFFRGIAFDSIAMDLFPVGVWFAADYSIFLYVFMLIFFGVCASFFCAKPQAKAELVLDF